MKMRNFKRAFTLVELLVVIAIIGILIALLLPAVQAAREAARRLQCSNQIKQIATAMHTHHDAHGHFPTNGWDWAWIGSSDRGFGEEQPGGWIFNVLPYMEQKEIHDMLAGVSDLTQAANISKSMRQIPIDSMNCPSRRTAKLYPTRVAGSSYYQSNPRLAIGSNTVDGQEANAVARSCYAGNGGSVWTSFSIGSVSDFERQFAAGALKEYSDTSNGIFFPCSMISVRDVTDGTSSTFLVGEKGLNADHYVDGGDYGDNENLIIGDDMDITRWTSVDHPPIQDTPGLAAYYSFGSPHPQAFNMAYCDGSVRTVSYDIDLKLYTNLGNRKDGEVLNLRQQ
ncbi:MAG: DUF1559 domain-containing protein [Pirellulales bacterium]|nr:DUF1559 domain-containing protein [Pirellulales bacterium]